MRIAVTGAVGQVSRALQASAAPGLTIAPVARPRFDLMTPSTALPALRETGADVIVHAAAFTDVEQAEATPETARVVNETGACAVAEAAAAMGAPLIYLSTDYVFDGGARTPYREDDPTAPLNAYGASKLAGERVVADAQPQSVILRLSWVYGPIGRNFARTMLALARTRQEISVVADQISRPTATHEIAASLVTIARQLLGAASADSFGVFHLGGEGEASWADFAEAIFRRSKALGGPAAVVRPVSSAEFGARVVRPAYSRLSGEKLARVYGVRLGHWRDALAAAMPEILRD